MIPTTETGPGTLRPIDWTLGEGSAAERAEFEVRAGADPALTLEMADLVEFFDRARSLRVEPSPTLGFELARMVRAERRRLDLRQPTGLGRGAWGAFLAAAVLVLGVLLWWRPQPGARDYAPPVGLPMAKSSPGQDRWQGAFTGDAVLIEPSMGVASMGPDLPFSEDTQPQLFAAWERLADRTGPDPLTGWLAPRNSWMVQRLEAQLRGSAELRRLALRRSGGNPDADDRVQDLAAGIAAAVETAMAAGTATPSEVACALRALLASGSTPDHGDNAAMVATCRDLLLDAVARPNLRGGELTAALAALVEPAVMSRSVRSAVREHGERLVRETLDATDLPPLLGWNTSLGSLAEAGRLLSILPAFGIDPDEAFLVRKLALAHLEERRARSTGPEVALAQVYGYADLVDRQALEQHLRAWRPMALLPDFQAMQHLAWSREPGAAGWTRFQIGLRRLAAVPTPESLTDRAALLMSLATDYAAPGVAQLLTLAD